MANTQWFFKKPAFREPEGGLGVAACKGESMHFVWGNQLFIQRIKVGVSMQLVNGLSFQVRYLEARETPALSVIPGQRSPWRLSAGFSVSFSYTSPNYLLFGSWRKTFQEK